MLAAGVQSHLAGIACLQDCSEVSIMKARGANQNCPTKTENLYRILYRILRQNGKAAKTMVMQVV
jgi:hypothetical protein